MTYNKYSLSNIKNTFKNCICANKEYKEFKSWCYKENRLKHLFNTDRVKLNNKIVEALTEEKQKLIDVNICNSKLYELYELILLIQNDTSKLKARALGRDKAAKTIKIKKQHEEKTSIENKLNIYSPDLSEYCKIKYSPISKNKLYEPCYNNDGLLSFKRSPAYQRWIYVLLKNYSEYIRNFFKDVNLNSKLILHINLIVCGDRYDHGNFQAALTDAVAYILGLENDNNIVCGVNEIIQRCNNKSDEMIYLCLKEYH